VILPTPADTDLHGGAFVARALVRAAMTLVSSQSRVNQFRKITGSLRAIGISEQLAREAPYNHPLLDGGRVGDPPYFFQQPSESFRENIWRRQQTHYQKCFRLEVEIETGLYENVAPVEQ
jgi:hypothetical protein